MQQTSITPNVPEIVWRDKKKYLWPIAGWVPMIISFVAYALYLLTGSNWSWWAGPIFVFAVIPMLDWILGTDEENPPDSVIPTLEKNPFYRWAIFSAVPIEYAALIFSTWVIATDNLDIWSYIGLAITTGFTTGISINTAHEIGHKLAPIEQWMAKIALAPTMYGHFVIEHNRGHHVRVATPEDPASSRYNENFWTSFLFRSTWNGIKSGLELERARLTAKKQSFWSFHNAIFHSWAITIILFISLTAYFGWIVLPFLLIQAIYGFSLLEVVNYLEHYGIKRAKLSSGRYERCQPKHSWNSNHRATNLFLFHLQRHSDHHANPTRSYQALRHFEGTAQLPSGYAGMIVLAYIPPLWFRYMNPKVKAFYNGDLSLANHGSEKASSWSATNDVYEESFKQQVHEVENIQPPK